MSNLELKPQKGVLMTQIATERKVVIPVPEVLQSLKDRHSVLVASFKTKQEEVTKLEQDIGSIVAVYNAYYFLKKVWEQKDPGKNGVVYFLTDAFGLAIITKEMVPQEHWEDKSVRERLRDIPPWCEKCPNCHERLPVIMTYEQTEDSPSGDEWTKTWKIYCPKCYRITQAREPKTCDHRF